MSIDGIGTVAREYVQAKKGAGDFQPSPKAADFAAMIKKLAGPEMLWKEQASEQVQENAAGDDTDARAVLVSGKKLRW